MEIQLCSICKETEEKTGIDIGRFLEELKLIKGKELSDYEKKYLCLSLAYYTNAQIAYFMYKHELVTVEQASVYPDIKRMIRNMNSEMSQENSVNYCIRKMMELDRRPSWTIVINFLKEKGFLKVSTVETTIKNQAYILTSDGKLTAEEIQKILAANGIKGIKIQEIN